ncbi:MAG: hypothetical protein KC964_08575 [Candidatus Omnitrophica bacterium]|nr:hypothetical protein [Candidatus Omnitrophota bacterium]
MVRLARSLTLILAIGTVGWPFAIVIGVAGTVDDCGDSPFDSPCVIQESQIAVKTFIAGNIEEPGDIDVFQFEVRAEDVGSLYLIETIIPDGDPFSDTYLRLLGKDGTSEIVSDNDSGVGGGSKILWSPEEAGNYFAEVTQFFSTEIGLYQIAVFRAGIAPPDDHGDDAAAATEMVVGGAPLSGSTELSADRDWFKFRIEANRFYDVETSNLETGSDTVITLFAEDGLTPLDTDDQGGREFNASRISWISPSNLPLGGVFYYLEVQQFLSGTSGVGYDVSVTSTGEPLEVSTKGEPLNGEIEEAGEIDAYVFSATEMSIFTVSLQAATNELNLFELRLLDPDGITLVKSQKNLEFENLTETLGASGDYFLLATNEFEMGSYVLSATLESPEGNPDLNLDGRIDHLDFLLLLEAYQEEK